MVTNTPAILLHSHSSDKVAYRPVTVKYHLQPEKRTGRRATAHWSVHKGTTHPSVTDKSIVSYLPTSSMPPPEPRPRTLNAPTTSRPQPDHAQPTTHTSAVSAPTTHHLEPTHAPSAPRPRPTYNPTTCRQRPDHAPPATRPHPARSPTTPRPHSVRAPLTTPPTPRRRPDDAPLTSRQRPANDPARAVLISARCLDVIDRMLPAASRSNRQTECATCLEQDTAATERVKRALFPLFLYQYARQRDMGGGGNKTKRELVGERRARLQAAKRKVEWTRKFNREMGTGRERGRRGARTGQVRAPKASSRQFVPNCVHWAAH